MSPRMQLVFGILILSASPTRGYGPASPDGPEKDPEMVNLLKEARTSISNNKPQLAIEKCEQVIASFKAFYEGRKDVIYCARTSAENLGYLLRAATEIEQGKFNPDRTKAITLSPTWSNAYFLKAYALLDLHRTPEAKSTLKLAIELSPWNSQYLSELGNIYQLEKNWPKAKECFQIAEEHAELSPDEAKAKDLARARRGLAYVFVELQQLDEAEKKYEQCLAANPNDTKAARELEYVRGLRAKAQSNEPLVIARGTPTGR